MPQTINNLGIFFQKFYFKGITFDEAGNYKKNEAGGIKEKNKSLFGVHPVATEYFVNARDKNRFQLKSIYPGVVTGIGMKHETAIEGELKLGMYFDYSSGMPCIPGASVKGALRAAFPQTGNHKNTSNDVKVAKCYILNEILSKINITAFPAITKNPEDCKLDDFRKISELEAEIFDGKNFDNNKRDGNGNKKENLSVYEKDLFHDAFIVKGDKNGRLLGNDAITNHPAELVNPVPVLFLKMLPGITIQFNFDLKQGVLLSSAEKAELFKEIIRYYGIGAKTNVGYGQLEPV